jgi:hypothetical protein
VGSDGWSLKFVYICDALVTQTSMAFLKSFIHLFYLLLALRSSYGNDVAVRLTVERKSVEGVGLCGLRGLSEY